MPEHESNNSRSASDSETNNTGIYTCELKHNTRSGPLTKPPNRFS